MSFITEYFKIFSKKYCWLLLSETSELRTKLFTSLNWNIVHHFFYFIHQICMLWFSVQIQSEALSGVLCIEPSSSEVL